ncbi:TolC family protein [soil metagenome]
MSRRRELSSVTGSQTSPELALLSNESVAKLANNLTPSPAQIGTRRFNCQRLTLTPKPIVTTIISIVGWESLPAIGKSSQLAPTAESVHFHGHGLPITVVIPPFCFHDRARPAEAAVRLRPLLTASVLWSLLGVPVMAQVPGPDAAGKKLKPAELEPPPGTILQTGEMPIDLGTALTLAGVANPALQLARQRVTEALAIKQLAAAQLLPNLNVGTNYDLHLGPVQQSNGNILNVHRNSLYYGLGANAIAAGTVNVPGLNYNLNVGVSWYSYLIARQRITTTATAADAANNDTLLRVYVAYLDLLRGEGRQSIAARNRSDAAEIARITTEFANTGQGRKADADRATVELRRRDAELTQAEADTLIASARLCRLLNLDPSTRLKPIDGWVVPAPLVPDQMPLSELLVVALLQRPELATRRSEVQAALYELSLAKVLPFSPNVILGFSAGEFGGGGIANTPVGPVQTSPRFGNFDGRTDLDVVVFWTFRNLGVGNIALTKAADSRVKQIRFREMETINTVRSQVAEAHALTASTFLQIDAAEKAVRASGEAFTQDQARIKGGQGLPLEVVDSMRLLARSRNDYLDTIIDYNRAQIQLWVSLGKPPANTLARPVPADLLPKP